jgi:hypothetical protein
MGQTDLDADLTFFFALLLPLAWRLKLNSRTLKKEQMKLEGMNKT